MKPVTRGHARALPGTSMSHDDPPRGPKLPGNQTESPTRPDPFTNDERVKRCTRFVPEGRTATLPAKKKDLQKTLKPTPGLEPGTPSLRGKDK